MNATDSTISQIPHCTSPISHNAPFCNRNLHMCANFYCKMMNCVIFFGCIVGYVTVRRIYYHTVRSLLRFVEIWHWHIHFWLCFTVILGNIITLQWRHNGRDGVSNHQPRQCLLNRLFGRRSKKTSQRKCFHLMTSSWMTAEFVKQPWRIWINVSHEFGKK